jgi:hypothetical protein
MAVMELLISKYIKIMDMKKSTILLSVTFCISVTTVVAILGLISTYRYGSTDAYLSSQPVSGSINLFTKPTEIERLSKSKITHIVKQPYIDGGYSSDEYEVELDLMDDANIVRNIAGLDIRTSNSKFNLSVSFEENGVFFATLPTSVVELFNPQALRLSKGIIYRLEDADLPSTIANQHNLSSDDRYYFYTDSYKVGSFQAFKAISGEAVGFKEGDASVSFYIYCIASNGLGLAECDHYVTSLRVKASKQPNYSPN